MSVWKSLISKHAKIETSLNLVYINDKKIYNCYDKDLNTICMLTIVGNNYFCIATNIRFNGKDINKSKIFEKGILSYDYFGTIPKPTNSYNGIYDNSFEKYYLAYIFYICITDTMTILCINKINKSI